MFKFNWQRSNSAAADQTDADGHDPVLLPAGTTAEEQQEFAAAVNKAVDTNPLVAACATAGLDTPEAVAAAAKDAVAYAALGDVAKLQADAAAYAAHMGGVRTKAKENATIAFGADAAADHCILDHLSGEALTTYAGRMQKAAEAVAPPQGGQRQSASTLVADDADKGTGKPAASAGADKGEEPEPVSATAVYSEMNSPSRRTSRRAAVKSGD